MKRDAEETAAAGSTTRSRPVFALKISWAASLAIALLVAAACGGDDAPDVTLPVVTVTPGSTPTQDAGDPNGPTVTPAEPDVTEIPTASEDDPLYIALGDSLSYGVSASDPDRTSFVALVHQGFTTDIGLLNLGVPGHTSEDLLNEGELDRAIAEITARLEDGIEGNEVEVVTLEIGGNDLLNIYFDFVLTETCVSVEQALDEPECVQALEDALAGLESNLDQILARLRQADPDLPIFLMTLYNPFSGRDPDIARVGDLALEGEDGTPFPTGINDIIRDTGPRYDAVMVELFPLFEGQARELVSFDLIHPNDDGYAVIAAELLAAMSEYGLPVVE